MAEGGVEVVAPEQGDYATAQPDAFWIASGAGQEPRRFRNFVDLFLAFLGGVSGGLLRFGRLAVTATLREGDWTTEAEGCRAAKHGKSLTQLDRETHCPRRMFELASMPVRLTCVGPDWDANTAVIYLVNPPPLIRRHAQRDKPNYKNWPQRPDFVQLNRFPCLRRQAWGHAWQRR